jgi:hypothetical protein
MLSRMPRKVGLSSQAWLVTSATTARSALIASQCAMRTNFT